MPVPANKQPPGDIAIGRLEHQLKRSRRWLLEIPIGITTVWVDARIEFPHEQAGTIRRGGSKQDRQLASVDVRDALLDIDEPEDLTPTRAPVLIDLLPAVLERAQIAYQASGLALERGVSLGVEIDLPLANPELQEVVRGGELADVAQDVGHGAGETSSRPPIRSTDVS